MQERGTKVSVQLGMPVCTNIQSWLPPFSLRTFYITVLRPIILGPRAKYLPFVVSSLVHSSEYSCVANTLAWNSIPLRYTWRLFTPSVGAAWDIGKVSGAFRVFWRTRNRARLESGNGLGYTSRTERCKVRWKTWVGYVVIFVQFHNPSQNVFEFPNQTISKVLGLLLYIKL